MFLKTYGHGNGASALAFVQADEARRQLQQTEAELRDVKEAAAAAEQRNAELTQQLAAAHAAAGAAATPDAAGASVPATPAASPAKAPGQAAAAGASDAEQV